MGEFGTSVRVSVGCLGVSFQSKSQKAISYQLSYQLLGNVINGSLVFNWGTGYMVWGDVATYPFKMYSVVDFGDKFRGDDFGLTQIFCPPGLVTKDLDFDTLDGTIPWCEDEEDCPFLDSAF